MRIPRKAMRVDLATNADGEREVDLLRRYGEVKVKQLDIEPSYLNELKERRLNVTSNIKNIRLLTDIVLGFTGLCLVGTGILGYGIGDLSFKIMIIGASVGLLNYLGMIITQHKIDKIRDKIAEERKKSRIYTQARTAVRENYT